MSRSKVRYALAGLPVLLALSLLPALGGSASATVAAGKGAKATCKQLTKAQIQPLMAAPITKIKVTKALQTGQQCVFSGSGDEGSGDAIDVLVIAGSEATQGFPEDVKGLGPKVAVPGVGGKTYRAKGDYQIISLKGSEYCSVSVGDDETVPGVSALETDGTSDIPESANTIIATALGTICNRIYGKGNTKPSLAGLSATVTTNS